MTDKPDRKLPDARTLSAAEFAAAIRQHDAETRRRLRDKQTGQFIKSLERKYGKAA